MSQINPKVKESHPDSYPTGPKQAHGGWGHNRGFGGYGLIAMITAQGALTFALMDRCGIEIDPKRLDAAYEFIKRGTGENGYVGYGDSSGDPNEWADLGRTGASGIAYFLAPKSSGSYRRLAQKHTDVIGKHDDLLRGGLHLHDPKAEPCDHRPGLAVTGRRPGDRIGDPTAYSGIHSGSCCATPSTSSSVSA